MHLKNAMTDPRICTRKLRAIDYLGAALTLAGCALIILPLIWVCLLMHLTRPS